MQKLEEILSPCFAMRFEGDDAWVEARPCINETERTLLIAKWANRAVQCGKNITGIRLFIKKSYGRVITVTNEEGKCE